MAFELYGMLAGNVSPLTGEPVKPAYGGDNEAFFNKVVKPIYNTIAQVCFCILYVIKNFLQLFSTLITLFLILNFLHYRKLRGVTKENQSILGGETTMI